MKSFWVVVDLRVRRKVRRLKSINIINRFSPYGHIGVRNLSLGLEVEKIVTFAKTQNNF